MKISCEVIKDLLPLYAEGLASSETAALVEEHLSSCESCRTELSKISSAIPIPPDTDAAPLKKIRSVLRKKRSVTILLSALISLIVAITVFGFLTSPSYIPYTSDVVAVTELENGTVTVQFGSSVTGYDIDKRIHENGAESYYHITAWDSIWGKWFKKSDPLTIMLNPDGSSVDRVYYYQANGEEDVLIYGQSQSEGVITLRRLVLNYYLILAFILAVICGLAAIFMRKNKTVQKVMINVLFVPLAYIAASICIMINRPVTYFAARDFFLIILLAMPIYGFLWFLFSKLRKAQSDKTVTK